MRLLSEQLRELPYEFQDVMEQHHDDRWPNIYNHIVNMFGAHEMINTLKKNNQPIESFLKWFYDLGFYAGVNFALDPQEEYDPNSDTII